MSELVEYQQRFIELSRQYEALSFGEFELKSGRLSPYFFNAGKFNSGGALSALGGCYADAIVASGIEFDFIFGPAYKGIPLAAVTAAALFERHGIDLPYCFNRKEAKSHGEGGMLVGAKPEGRGLIVDDVITAGTAIREAIGILDNAGAVAASVMIGLDRKERAPDSDLSAVMKLESESAIQVLSIVSLDDIREYLSADSDIELLNRIESYQAQYGV
jgi:orotate phosphoribosyltransferase